MRRWFAATFAAQMLVPGAAMAQTMREVCNLANDVYSLSAKTAAKSLPAGYKLLANVPAAEGTRVKAIAVEHVESGKVLIGIRGTFTSKELLGDFGILFRDIEKGLGDIGKTIGYQFKEGTKELAGKVAKAFGRKKKKDDPKWPVALTEDDGEKAIGSKLYARIAKGLKTHKELQEFKSISRTFVKNVLASAKKSDGARVRASDVILSAHSMGGYAAQVVALEYGVRAHTFNAPGARFYKENVSSPLIINHVREHDLFGRFGQHYGRVYSYGDEDVISKDSGAWISRNHDVENFCPVIEKYWGQSLERPK